MSAPNDSYEFFDAEAVIRRIKKRSTILANGYWQWTGPLEKSGYGRVGAGKRKWLAHRAAYAAFNGPIPEGLIIDHLCRNRGCVNPAHLETVTPQQNTLRGETLAAANVVKTHCAKGHPFDDHNTYFNPGKAGRARACRICSNQSSKEYYARKREASQ